MDARGVFKVVVRDGDSELQLLECEYGTGSVARPNVGIHLKPNCCGLEKIASAFQVKEKIC